MSMQRSFSNIPISSPGLSRPAATLKNRAGLQSVQSAEDDDAERPLAVGQTVRTLGHSGSQEDLAL